MKSQTRMIAIALGSAAAAALVLAVLYGNRPAPVHEEAVLSRAPSAPLALPASLPGVMPTDGMPMAPDAGFFDAGGGAVSLADFEGRFVVLNLWATWCAPCVAELPALARAQEALGEDVLILPVDMEEKTSEEIAAFLAQNGAETLPVYIDRDFAVMRAFEAFSVGLPYTIFIDEEGRQIATASGPQEWDDEEAVAYIRQMAGG